MTATVTPIRPNPPAEAGEGLAGPTVCVQAGITYRQLDYWTRVGWLHAVREDTPGTGYARRFSETETQIAATAKRLLDAGFGVPGGLVRIDPNGADR